MDIAAIQRALVEAELDGWLFYDFRGSDPLARAILGLQSRRIETRRWFYFLPAIGEPCKIVHAIESSALDGLPGRKLAYLPWQELRGQLGAVLTGRHRVAMQYSPSNNLPYISRVDGGTLELVRSFGVEVVSSADLVQLFEARLSEEQWRTHAEAADRLATLVSEVFGEIARRVRAGAEATEFDMRQFLLEAYERLGLVSDHPPIVAVAENTADPHYEPLAGESRRIEANQLVLVDIWAKTHAAGSIYADITWMGYTGTAVPREHASVFRTVQSARDAALEAVKRAQASGRPIRGRDVDDVCRGVIVAAGHGPHFLHRTGHSIHQTDHGNGANLDNLETSDDRRLIPRTLFSIEPGIYLPGKFGVRSEIDVFLPDAASVIVSGAPPQTEIVPLLG